VAPAASPIPQTHSSISSQNLSRPLMSSELPDAIPAPSSSPIQWTDEQLLSAGWTRLQIDSMRSLEKETQKDANLESEEWDTGW
ncbi:MAG: hypothetical protein QGH13_03460, partial [Candidatus Thalassarchaeaceae archaeon]|nr:hypothetical protein [Candidatus Thalassarchaeaceae archaeon]